MSISKLDFKKVGFDPAYNLEVVLMKLYGGADDVKPIDVYSGYKIADGSTFIEHVTGIKYFYDSDTKRWNKSSRGNSDSPSSPDAKSIITSLNSSKLCNVIEVIGIPEYIDDFNEYEDYGLTDSGWYAFIKITPKDGTPVSENTIVTGSDGYTIGDGFVNLAIRFDTIAYCKEIIIDWGDSVETFAFRSSDLSERNLDYRSTYTIYDLEELDYVTWAYSRTTDTTVQNGKSYYTLNDGSYVLSDIAASTPIVSYYERIINYALTSDATFVDGKTYYTESEGTYTEATVTVGENVDAETYYEQTITHSLTTDTEFIDGKTYYTYSNGAYSEATVTAGDPIIVYYAHSKVTISGMTRNITYVLNQAVDCPIELVMPEIVGDQYGVWFDFEFYHSGTYSITITVPTGAKMATSNTPNPTKGINLLHMHYSSVAGRKVWTAMNTHTNFNED